MTTPGTTWTSKLQRQTREKAGSKTARRHSVRVALVASNLFILALIGLFVLQNPHTSNQPIAALGSAAAANPVDQVSSADIALTVARMSSLPETTAINNQAQSQAADIAVAASNNNVTSKPEVIATALKSRADIEEYVFQPGDSIPNLATKFGITSDSIRWSNNITGDTVAVGTKLTIPPINGIVYTVKAGDTADSLALRYSANKDQILAYNDAEIAGLQPGEQIIIPNAQNATTAAGIAAAAGVGSNAAFPWGNGPMYGYNGYDYGYCTWYVATQINVPANWGNASTWAYYARLSGWHVSSTPTVGSIAQKGGGDGHVGIVVGVNPDGSIVLRDMNGIAGWGNVGTAVRPASTFQNYITH